MPQRHVLAMLCFATSLLVIGCVESYENEGSLCLHSDGMPERFDHGTEEDRIAAFKANTPIGFSVKMTGCMSGSCAGNLQADCSAELKEGNILKVTSSGSFDSKPCGLGRTGDCLQLQAQCELPDGLPAGDYRVEHGSDVMNITVHDDPGAIRVRQPCTE